jgi:GDPmannose 4,6-dehydratase
MKKVLITGITGQDGSYLAEFLLEKGYEVHGIVRRAALENPHSRFSRIRHIQTDLYLHPGDITNYASVLEVFDTVRPDECFHLAAQSFVGESFKDPFTTFKVNTEGTLHILAAAKKKAPRCKIYFAATSEMYGEVQEMPQTEKTVFYPRSPYGVSKVAGFHMIRNYREAYNMFVCSGTLFNHESERRGHEFVTRKITQAVARMKHGKQNVLVLGNIHAKRDWGHAEDYIKAMWLMLQQESPDDFVIASGETHTVKEFLDLAFAAVDMQYELIDLHELSSEEADKRVAYLEQDKSKLFVVQHPRFYRPAEVDVLLGDPTKAKITLGWRPEVSFSELVQRMVENDLQLES